MVCCKAFENYLGQMGRAGISFIAVYGDKKPYFMIQSRACDVDQVPALKRIASGPVKIALDATTGLKFCPACGTDLTEWISKNPKEMERLLERSISYMPPIANRPK